MTKKPKILLISLSIILLAAVAFAIWSVMQKDKFFTSKPKTMAVSAVIESQGNSKLITADGGKIELASDTIKAELNLAKNSLVESQTIVLRKIKSLDTGISQWKFISGVEITPDGTDLMKPGELTIDIPSGTNLDDLSGFSFAGGGKDFYLYPIKIINNKAVFQLNGFSGYGLINLGGYEPKTQPTETSKQANQQISKIIAEGQTWGKGGLDQDRLDRIANILQAWYKTEVKTSLSSAEKNDALIDQAGYEFTKWLSRVQIFGLEERFAKEIASSYKSLAKGIKYASDKSSKKCIDENDAFQTSKMLHLYAFAEMTGIDGKEGLNSEDIKENAQKCANFELKISSSFEDQCSTCDTPDIGNYSGTINLHADVALSLTGEGQITIDSYKENVGSKFEHGCTYSTDLKYPVGVPQTQVKTIGDKPKISLLFSIKDTGDYKADCSFDIDEVDMKITGNAIGASFDLDFIDLHEDEKQSESDQEAVFLISDWEIVSKEGVFAKKVYNRSKTSPGVLGASGTIKENTVFELLHKPKK